MNKKYFNMFGLALIANLLNFGVLSMAEDDEGGGSDKEKITVEELQKKITDMEKQLSDKDEHIKKNDGVLNELRNVRQELSLTKQQMAEKVKGKADELGIDVSDEDFIQGKDMKRIIKSIQEDNKKNIQDFTNNLMTLRAKERLADDEDRMQAKTLDVSYEQAMDEFKKLAEEDPGLWDQVNRESHRPGGKPAQLAYKIALRDSPELSKLITQKQRDKVIEEIEKTGKLPKKITGGGSGKLDPNNLTEKDIYAMSDEELDELSRQI